jgi:hypothetical protein
MLSTITTTKPLISNKLRRARNETHSKSIRSEISNINKTTQIYSIKIKIK